MNTRIFALLCLLGLPAWTPPAGAAESYDNCSGFITSLPTVISTPGIWCLKQDLATNIASGTAISISTNNVTIDCNGFKLGGLAAGLGTSTYGIFAFNRVNLTIRRCNIRGFQFGVLIEGINSTGNLVEDNRFDTNTHTGLWLEGDGSVARRNQVFNTGGSTVITAGARGIGTVYSVDVLDNTVSGVTANSGSNGYAYGIYTTQNPDGRIEGNGIHGLLPDGSGLAIGIYSLSTGRVILRNNDLVGNGGTGSAGVHCFNSQGTAIGNVTSAFATAIEFCSDGGGNYNNP